MPLEIALNDCDHVLICQKVIRFVPHKRLVVFGTWGNQAVVAKIFFNPKKGKETCLRDAQGVKALAAVNIPTAKLLYVGTALTDTQLHVLILEKIDHAMTLSEIWRIKKSIEEVTPLMRAVVIEIATHHVLGILQRDLHMKNFLITSKTIYSLDGSKIVEYQNPLPKKISLSYLALFLVQLGVGTEQLRQDLFEVYAKSRGWLIKKADIRRVRRETIRIRRDLSGRYLNKIFRNCTAFKKMSSLTQCTIYDREYKSPALMTLLADPDSFFENKKSQMLKSGRSSTVIKVMINDQAFVVKRYNIKNIWHRLRRFLRKTRAATSWRLSQKLFSQGIPTAKPVAFIEKRFLGFRGRSYFIMAYVPGQHSGEYFLSRERDERALKAMAERILTLLINLKEMRLIHGDLKMTNILIDNEKPILIDLDGMTEHRSMFRFHQFFAKEIKRFMKNWEKSPTIRALFDDLFSEKLV